MAAAAVLWIVTLPATCRSLSIEVGTPGLANAPAVAAPTSVPPLTQVSSPTPTSIAATTGPATELLPTPTPAIPSFAPKAVASGQAAGEILNSRQADLYKLDGQAGQWLEVNVQRLGGRLSPYLELIDPSGVDEIPWTGALVVSPVLHKLVSTGPYAIRITAYDTTGPYSIAWSLDRFGQLADGGRTTSEITDSFRADRYRFEGGQGQTLRAHVQRTAGVSLQPSTQLVDPSGAREASADSVGQPNVLLQTKLASSGAYVLVVGGRNTGPYEVTVSLS
jgi:hypothetical protein